MKSNAASYRLAKFEKTFQKNLLSAGAKEKTSGDWWPRALAGIPETISGNRKGSQAAS